MTVSENAAHRDWKNLNSSSSMSDMVSSPGSTTAGAVCEREREREGERGSERGSERERVRERERVSESV